MNWFATTLIVVIYYSYTNGSHKGFVEFCVIEVFKFWVILRWMNEGWKSLSLGMPRNPKLLSKNEQPTKLGDAPSGIASFFWWPLVFYSKLYFYSSHTMSFAWSVLYDRSFACFALCFKSWVLAGHTYLREPKLCHDLLELLSMLHLNFYELWNCSTASLISFWAWYALVFLKKCSLVSLRFIWELVKFSRNSLLLHLN